MQRFEFRAVVPAVNLRAAGYRMRRHGVLLPKPRAARHLGRYGGHYEHHGGTSGPLGFPVDDEAKAGPSQRETERGTVGWCQRFEGGVICYTEKTREVIMRTAVAAHHDEHGGVTGSLVWCLVISR